MSVGVDYQAKYEHLCTVVGVAVSELHDAAQLLEITARRMTSTAANCASTARTLKHIEHTLIVEVHHE